MLRSPYVRSSALIFAVLLLAALPGFAQGNGETGKLKIQVSPKQAYVFVDGKAIRDGSQTIELAPGTHEVSVRNYGFIANTQKIDVRAGETSRLNVALEASGDKVSGPFGDIEFKGHPRAAVLLNGTTPDYFVGHVDEFDWNWIWHQRLLVKPGTYHVTVTREGNTIWSGPVTVKAAQQVTVYLDQNGRTRTKDWPEGNTMPPQPRFHAGIASATVPIAPVTAQLTAQSNQVGCGQPAELKWKSADAVAVTITNVGSVPLSGDRSVSPLKTTEYELVAKGPGCEATQAATVRVATEPTATISLSEPEVHYHKIGDKVVEDGSVTLKWATSNASKVTIASLGSEPLSGSQLIEARPSQTGAGPVNEVIPYKLSASNTCGGTTSQTASLRVVGSIDPPPPVTVASVFFPTNYPRPRHPRIGLVASEQQALSRALKSFENHEQYDNDQATLMIVGHADIRGPKRYNLKLSERRADAVRNYLVSNGISGAKIQTRADGKEEELKERQVEKLQAEDAQKPENWMMRHSRATWLAYNRRVDVILEPSGQQSTESYPNDASDARILWQRPEPSLKKVELAAKKPAVAGSLQAALARN
jgi:OmpA family/PEGA domain